MSATSPDAAFAPPTLSAVASPARTSPTPAPGRASRGPARVFGARCSESFASYDPATCSWRTSQLCLLEDWAEFSETWPRAGMTRSGTAFQLRPLAPLTDVTESGCLPTPAATAYGTNQGGAMGRTGPVRPSLDSMARHGLWPTPSSRDWKDTGQGRMGDGQLPEAVRRSMWPTPTQADAMGGPGTSGRAGGLNLRTAVSQWPTPNSRDWKGSPGQGSRERGGRQASLPASVPDPGPLNPTFVSVLMGFPPDWTEVE
jgi:hypothetical protein